LTVYQRMQQDNRLKKPSKTIRGPGGGEAEILLSQEACEKGC